MLGCLRYLQFQPLLELRNLVDPLHLSLMLFSKRLSHMLNTLTQARAEE